MCALSEEANGHRWSCQLCQRASVGLDQVCWSGCVALQSRFSSLDQFKVLHERYPLVTNSTKGLLLSTYLKMLLSDPSNSALQTEVTAVFGKCSHQIDPDLQQRSAEYLVGGMHSTQHTAS